ncbi:lysophospholipid acyltransferase family protein [Thiomicrorhabdus sp. ZW0627]|uniref:lysophospholipid acyltransferase family protein n=1 Tax=Thiomicrorhabdus sp. ZW0627 TaxID=3039774 RepID=UPI002436E2C0|nr:lysophospholipid acyltransferase family protein [Thiomicrorhabdus sp. ZW0627]MDG6774495.1 lysophospholipid acyltransferase family protein [Thiomicrorhabdus sp. ZW0627]
MSKRAQSDSNQNRQAWLGGLLKGLVVVFSWMPLRMNRWFGSLIGLLMWWIPNSNKRVSEKNIAVAFPELSAEEQSQLVKRSLMHLGQVVTELGPAWCWPESKLLPLIKEVKGQAFLDQARAQNKGILLLAPHIGAWEVNGMYTSTTQESTYLYRPPNIPSVEAFMVKARSRYGAKLSPTDMRGVRDLVKGLKAQQLSAILPDQDPGERGGVYAPFFGRPARTMTLVSKLIQKSDCAFLFVVMERLPKAQGYRLHVLPAEPEVASEDEEVAAAALNRGVEACIRIAPEQYLWSYKRYRHPPEGVEDIYKA